MRNLSKGSDLILFFFRNKENFLNFNLLRSAGILIVVLLNYNYSVQAATFTSTLAGGNWNSSSSWIGGIVPGATDEVLIVAGSTITVTANASAGKISVSGTLDIDKDITLTISGDVIINSGGTIYCKNGGGQTLIVYGDYENNGVTDFNQADVVVVGNFTSPITSTLQNQGTLIIGGNAIGAVNQSGGNQVYTINPNDDYSSFTATPTAITSPPTSGPIADLINTYIYGGTCSSFSINGPVNAFSCSGSDVTFTVTSRPFTSPTYQWEVNPGTGWAAVGTGVVSGSGTSALTITSPALVMDGYNYRCKITDGCYKYSFTATLDVSATGSAPGIPVFASGTTSSRCIGTGDVTYPATSTNSGYVIYSLDATSLAAGNIISPSKGTVSYTAGWTGTSIITATAFGCGLPVSSNHSAVTSSPVITTGSISGTASVCSGQAGVGYTVNLIQNALSYIWSYTGTGATILGSTNSVTINFASNATSGNLTVRGANVCGNGPVSAVLAITVNALPVTPTVIAITQPTCASATGSVELSGLPVGNWTLNPGSISGIGANYTVTGLTGGNTYNFTVNNAAGCTSLPTSNVVINVQSTAPAAATASTTIQPTCAIATGTITVSAPIGAGYEYNIDGGTYQLSPVFTGVTSGAHIIRVRWTTNITCISSPTFVIVNSQPPVPAAATASTTIQPTCVDPTGTITVSAPIGAGYEYNIDGGTYQLLPVFAGTSPGPHTILVRRNTDPTCTSTPTVVTVSVPLSTPSLIITNPGAVCSPATVNLTSSSVTSGSTAGLTYTYWSDDAATVPYLTPSGATNGTYYIKGAAASGCYDVKPVLVTVNPNPEISGTQVNVLCFGDSNGSIDITVISGTAPFIYAWTGTGILTASQDQTGLSEGAYSVIVSDSRGCTSSSSSFTITQPVALSGAITSQANVSVIGGNDGSLTVAGSGGTSPYLYRLGTGAFQPSGAFGSLTAGSYTITIQDINLCTFNVIADITQPSSSVSGSIVSKSDVLCFGGATGSITVAGSGGKTPYEYKLDEGTYQLPGAFGSLSAGHHKITIRDALMVTYELNFIITQPSSAVGGTVIAQTNALCFGRSSGSVTVGGSGGIAPYKYKLGSGVYQNSGTFGSLAAGSHTLTVQDANLCTFTIQVVITEPQELAVSAVREDVSCPGVSDGKISLTITGGTTPYQVLWSDGVTTLDRQTISAGAYSVVVTDRNGCTSSLNIAIEYIGSESCLEIQEIITPNNDGFYDKWKIKNIELFPNAEVQVFNRLGKRVFSSKNISANEWDGTFNGELMPTDSYHYILYLNDGSEPRSGVVSIIR